MRAGPVGCRTSVFPASRASLSPRLISHQRSTCGLVAQRKSTRLTREGSLVRTQPGPQNLQVEGRHAHGRSTRRSRTEPERYQEPKECAAQTVLRRTNTCGVSAADGSLCADAVGHDTVVASITQGSCMVHLVCRPSGPTTFHAGSHGQPTEAEQVLKDCLPGDGCAGMSTTGVLPRFLSKNPAYRVHQGVEISLGPVLRASRARLRGR